MNKLLAINVLKAVRDLQGTRFGAGLEPISKYMVADKLKIEKLLKKMLLGNFDRDYGSLVTYDHIKDRFNVSGLKRDNMNTGGYKYLEDHEVNTVDAKNTTSWKNEVLTGIDQRGKRSKIKNPVLF